MTMSRRELLVASGLSLLGISRARGQGAPANQTQSQNPSPPQTRLLEALQANRLPFTMSDGNPAGRGWDWLVQQARNARFTLVGEEHGVAETAQFAAALFKALRPAGYRRVAVELSPLIGGDIQTAARRNGLQGILNFFAIPNAWTPMHMREEAQFLAAVIGAGPKN